jgi:hypothetical protein
MIPHRILLDLMTRKSHEAPHYATFFSLPSLPIS